MIITPRSCSCVSLSLFAAWMINLIKWIEERGKQDQCTWIMTFIVIIVCRSTHAMHAHEPDSVLDHVPIHECQWFQRTQTG